MTKRATSIDCFMEGVKERNPDQKEFHQAVHDVVADIIPWLQDRDDDGGDYLEQQVLERLTEPDRIVTFRVCWHDDDNNIRVNRGWRVQNSSAIGPYKGGLRFHSSVNESILKFLAFEQTFKNALTGMPLGGGKGGSNFNPRGKSDREVMRFCQSFMTELYRHIGESTDVPAGDIGVGAREIGFLFGQYKRIENRFGGALTGKGQTWGGSAMRTEATGYGAVYFLEQMLKQHDKELDGMRLVISGSGNVALHAAEKAIERGATVHTLSDSDGFVHDKEGMDADKLAWVRELKNERGGRIKEYADEFDASFHEGNPWHVDCDVAIPCATQNELSDEDAKDLIDNEVIAIVEGANMPTETDGVTRFREAGVLFAPAKAANAGGVAVSGLEMSQNAGKLYRDADDLAQVLESTMADIHDRCCEYGDVDGNVIDYTRGANIAGFLKVADATLAYGVF